jgi:hypothetical protein
MFRDVASTAIVLCSDFEYANGEPMHDDDGWPELSLEARIRLDAFGVVACSQEVQFSQVVFSGGLLAEASDGTVVNEAETTEHAFRKSFKPNQTGQLVVSTDANCSTTVSSARSVRAELEAQRLPLDSEEPYSLVTSRTHVARACKAFEQEGMHIRAFSAEDILLNAAKFGWEGEAATRFVRQADDYVHSMRYRTHWVTEHLIFPVVTLGPLGNVAERRMVATRASRAQAS